MTRVLEKYLSVFGDVVNKVLFLRFVWLFFVKLSFLNFTNAKILIWRLFISIFSLWYSYFTTISNKFAFIYVPIYCYHRHSIQNSRLGIEKFTCVARRFDPFSRSTNTWYLLK